MKTTNVITIRNILILLVGACYCVVGGLFLANSALIEAFIGWLPLTMYVISAIIVVPIVLKNRGAWDEFISHLFYRMMAFAFAITVIPLGVLAYLNYQDGMSGHLIIGIIMLGFGAPTILFTLMVTGKN